MASAYGIAGGITTAVINWAVRDTPKLKPETMTNYILLFSAMGCLGGALSGVMFGQTESVGFFGGLIGSYVLVGVGNYF